MNKMIAYCGLDCANCDAYKATINNDEALRIKTAELWSKWNQVTILPSDINCLGCLGDGIKTPFCANYCQIRICARNKDLKNCGSCLELDTCEKIKMIISNNKEALANLKK